ncbi:MAG: hypothetical protein RLZZ450_6995 [Pseudomonadota bacterium]
MLADRDATIALQANTITSLTAKVEMLEVLVKKLVEERSRNSTNSNLPPSSDGPGGSAPKAGKKPHKKGRKRGGQPGHKGSHRVLVFSGAFDLIQSRRLGRSTRPVTAAPRSGGIVIHRSLAVSLRTDRSRARRGGRQLGMGSARQRAPLTGAPPVRAAAYRVRAPRVRDHLDRRIVTTRIGAWVSASRSRGALA